MCAGDLVACNSNRCSIRRGEAFQSESHHFRLVTKQRQQRTKVIKRGASLRRCPRSPLWLIPKQTLHTALEAYLCQAGCLSSLEIKRIDI